MNTRSEIVETARRVYRQGPWLRRGMQHYRPYICPFEELIPIVPTGSEVLDIGCGSGLFLILLAESGRLSKGVGFDINKDSVEYAIQSSQGIRNPGILSFHVAEETFEWPQAAFDVVSLIDVMHHIPPANQVAFLQKAMAALRPHGVLLYKDMVERPLWQAWANRVHDLVLARQWINYFPRAAVLRCADAAGMRLVRANNSSRLWYGHELIVLSRQ